MAAPTIIITAGMNWATTIRATNPRKAQPKRPIFWAFSGAAKAVVVVSAMVAATVAALWIKVLMASSS
jgi:hypothetical protein